MREKYKEIGSYSEVARIFGVSRQRVEQAVKRISIRAIKYRHRFLKMLSDFNKCITCGSKKQIVIHHIDKNRNNDDSSNLVPLCTACHLRIHNKFLRGERKTREVIKIVEKIDYKTIDMDNFFFLTRIANFEGIDNQAVIKLLIKLYIEKHRDMEKLLTVL